MGLPLQGYLDNTRFGAPNRGSESPVNFLIRGRSPKEPAKRRQSRPSSTLKDTGILQVPCPKLGLGLLQKRLAQIKINLVVLYTALS